MQQAFWFLSFLLVGSTIGGVVLSHEIIWLLFERGAFSAQDTANVEVVLQMYMLGLIPFGLQKLFVLWLYAKEMQMQSAKIATLSLITYSIFALTLITPFGVMGLALASTIGGFVSFFFTLKTFGFHHFINFIKSYNTLYLIVFSIVTTLVLVFVKDILPV
jgi:putative peptidoglycan lipid II flippase